MCERASAFLTETTGLKKLQKRLQKRYLHIRIAPSSPMPFQRIKTLE
jgi:hypothetical protein